MMLNKTWQYNFKTKCLINSKCKRIDGLKPGSDTELVFYFVSFLIKSQSQKMSDWRQFMSTKMEDK